ncbi:unnamed protein product, partial [Cylicostephanus goldi]
VYYYLDDDATPFVSILPVPPDEATLRDFKKVFTRKGFKYFCKGLDADIKREVKIELCDDSAALKKSTNGLIELFLHSCGGPGVLPRSGTLPRRGQAEYMPNMELSDKLFLHSCGGPGVLPRSGTLPRRGQAEYMPSMELSDKADRRRSLVNLDLLDASESTHPASSIGGTIVSRRAGEHLAELYTSNSENFYNDSTRSANYFIFRTSFSILHMYLVYHPSVSAFFTCSSKVTNYKEFHRPW